MTERATITTLNAARDGLLPAEMAQELAITALTAMPLETRDRFLGVLIAGHPQEGEPIPQPRMNILAGIANQTSLAIEAAQFYGQTLRQERLQREMELASEIQESFLPECCPETAGWEFAIEWRAARGVGGDYYDFIRLGPGRLGLVIADVSDKGVAAALYMAISRTVIRTVALEGNEPDETLRRVNRTLLQDARSGMFVTVFYGILELETGLLTYARAGHNPPILIRNADCAVFSLAAPGVVLGILDEPRIARGDVRLEPGDLLVMYTDGVTEATNGLDEEFGEERLAELLTRGSEHSAESLVRLVDGAVRSFTGERPQFDDLTLLVLKRAANPI